MAKRRKPQEGLTASQWQAWNRYFMENAAVIMEMKYQDLVASLGRQSAFSNLKDRPSRFLREEYIQECIRKTGVIPRDTPLEVTGE